jgi:hypothetical protein
MPASSDATIINAITSTIYAITSTQRCSAPVPFDQLTIVPAQAPKKIAHASRIAPSNVDH